MSGDDLDITKFELSSKFTQPEVDIFTEGGVASVSPVVSSTDAITPFKTQTISKLEQGNESEATIFDSYLLESSGGEYEYTFGLECKGEDWVGDEINKIDGIKNGGIYLIRGRYGQNDYLYDNGTSVGIGNSVYDANGHLNPDYLWEITRTGNDCIIKSKRGRYMQSSRADGNGVPLVSSKGNNDYFTVSTFPYDDVAGVLFKTTNGNNYLSMAGGKACGHTESTREFFLYEFSTTNVSRELTIPISVTDKNTGVASPLAAIKRNDFIDVLVSVKNNVSIESIVYQVESWSTVTNNIEFGNN